MHDAGYPQPPTGTNRSNISDPLWILCPCRNYVIYARDGIIVGISTGYAPADADNIGENVESKVAPDCVSSTNLPTTSISVLPASAGSKYPPFLYQAIPGTKNALASQSLAGKNV
jgi:hypothetical protein